jgi:hypothetical protein
VGIPATGGAGSAMVASAAECMLYFFSEETMIRFRRFLPLAAILVGAAFLGAPTSTQAAFTLRLQSGVADITVTDGGAGDVDGTVNGVITFAGAVGQVNIANINVATSNSASATVPAILSITNTEITSNTAAAITITVQDTGFTAPAPGAALMVSQLSNTQTPLSSATITFQSFLNGSPGTLITETSTSGFVMAPDFKSIGTSPYTLKNVTTIDITSVGGATILTTGQTSVEPSVVPAPAGVVLALAGVPCLGFGCWLRRRIQGVKQLAL